MLLASLALLTTGVSCGTANCPAYADWPMVALRDAATGTTQFQHAESAGTACGASGRTFVRHVCKTDDDALYSRLEAPVLERTGGSVSWPRSKTDDSNATSVPYGSGGFDSESKTSLRFLAPFNPDWDLARRYGHPVSFDARDMDPTDAPLLWNSDGAAAAPPLYCQRLISSRRSRTSTSPATRRSYYEPTL